MQNTFSIVGKLDAVKDTEKFKGYTESVSASGWKSHKLNFNVKNSTGSHLVSLYAGCKNEESDRLVYSFTKGNKAKGEKGKSIQIKWSDRLNKDIVDTIAEFKKFVIVLGEDKRMEFISEVDFLQALRKILASETYKDCKFKISGNMEFKNYEGKVYTTLSPNRIYLVEEDTQEESTANIDLFYSNDAIIDSYEDCQKVFLTDVYTRAYNSDLKDNESYKVSDIVADFSSVREEIREKMYNKFVEMFTVANNEVYNVGLKLNLKNGVSKIEITESMLSEEQLEMVELGFTTLNEIKKEMGSVNGARVKEMQFAGLARGFSNGRLETELTVADLTNSKSLFEDEEVEVAAGTTDEDLFGDMFA